jgi:hypothetical protein
MYFQSKANIEIYLIRYTGLGIHVLDRVLLNPGRCPRISYQYNNVLEFNFFFNEFF